MTSTMNPNQIAVQNGAFMGLDCALPDSGIVLFQMPWDVTTSYRAGTRFGPEHVIQASYQLDLFSAFLKNAWETQIHTVKIEPKWLEKSTKLRSRVDAYVSFLEEGGSPEENPNWQKELESLNAACVEFLEWSVSQIRPFVQAGKRVAVLGGDHSVTYAPVKALREKYSDLSVLHFDAHADLRIEYEGFSHSHASIMNRLLKESLVSKIVQVGIRDYCPEEFEQIDQDPRLCTFFDRDIKEQLFSGKSFAKIAADIVSQLGPRVYMSFDIDGLDPKLCPDTGTPVPGGLEFEHAVYLIEAVVKSGREIVGVDLVEVAPNSNPEVEWNGNVGARILWALLQAMESCRRVV